MILKLKSVYSNLISFCLVLLGFSSCLKDDPVDEYGVPSARYKIKGKILSKEDSNKPVPDIRVVMLSETNNIEGDTTYTNKEGLFEINRLDFPQNKFKIKIEDIDGDKNGSFDNREIAIEFDNSDYKGGSGSWYKGEASKDIGNIELTAKPKDN